MKVKCNILNHLLESLFGDGENMLVHILNIAAIIGLNDLVAIDR